MREHSRNAQILAEWLEEQPGVAAVHFPWLASHPQRALAERQQSGPGGIVTITPLPPLDPNESLIWKWVAGAYDWVFDRLPNSRILKPYQEAAVQNAADYEEVVKAMAGEPATVLRDAGKGKMILSAAVPVQRYRQVLGALLLTKPGDDIEATQIKTSL